MTSGPAGPGRRGHRGRRARPAGATTRALRGCRRDGDRRRTARRSGCPRWPQQHSRDQHVEVADLERPAAVDAARGTGPGAARRRRRAGPPGRRLPGRRRLHRQHRRGLAVPVRRPDRHPAARHPGLSRRPGPVVGGPRRDRLGDGGRTSPTAGSANYAAAKAAAEAWMLALADSLRRAQSGRKENPLPQTSAATILVIKALVDDRMRAAVPGAAASRGSPTSTIWPRGSSGYGRLTPRNCNGARIALELTGVRRDRPGRRDVQPLTAPPRRKDSTT